MVSDAIILCGGHSQRLKPHTNVSKPLLKLEPGLTLVDYQILWLQSCGFKRILLASREDSLTNLDVEYSIERKKMGTGGAMRKAAEMCRGKYVYAMNVDDILLGDYNPSQLAQYAQRGGVIVIAKPRLQFGRVKIEGGLITEFVQKPSLGFYVSAGHYTFRTNIIREYFPDKGDFEKKTSPKLASLGMLRGYPFDGLWLTINTYKELSNARKILRRRKAF